ncbi:hypothetical protein ACLB2K_067218 [Fragaria x ananassa]
MESGEYEEGMVVEFSANGNSMKATNVAANLDEGNIQEAESLLREGLSLNFEEARALLGKLEYQRGNLEGALRVFDGIDLQAAIERLQPSITEKTPSKKGRSRPDSQHSVSQHAATLVLDAIYLKAKSLHKLGRLTEAAHECKRVLDAVEKIFHQGIPDAQVDSRLQETVSRAVELLPELWKQAGSYQETITAYRRALLGQWNLDNDCCARIQKAFAVFLLYSGLEAGPPSLGVQVEGSYVPKNNLEEAILLLMILLRNLSQGKLKWDPSLIEHLTFALSICNQTSVLAKQIEEIMPGVYPRVDRWNSLALCYSGAGQNKAALNLLRKSLHKHERPDELMPLLLAAKICSEDSHVAAEGVGYAQRAVNNSQEHRNLNAALRYAKQFIDETGGSALKGWRLLALVLSAQQRFSEAHVVTDAALDETAKWEQGPLLRLKAKLKISQSLPMDAIETYRNLLALVQAQRKSFGPLRVNSQTEDDKVNELEVWHGLSNLYASLSYWRDAEICLGKARELKLFAAETLHAEGIILEGCGRSHEALVTYINALMQEPYYVPGKIGVAVLMSKMGPKALPVARKMMDGWLMQQTAFRQLPCLKNLILSKVSAVLCDDHAVKWEPFTRATWELGIFSFWNLDIILIHLP